MMAHVMDCVVALLLQYRVPWHHASRRLRNEESQWQYDLQIRHHAAINVDKGEVCEEETQVRVGAVPTWCLGVWDGMDAGGRPDG